MLHDPAPTTSLQDIRSFLDRHGTNPPPWSPPRAPVDALLQLLHDHRDDEAFWAELTELTERLDDARVRPQLIRGAEVLGGADARELLATLRDALPADEVPPASAWARATPAAGAIAALLLLGSSLGCAVCPEAGRDGIATDQQTVYCSLVDLINGADVDNATANEVMDCLPELGAAHREDLLEQFENASEEELADLLESLAGGPDCDDSYNDH